MEGLPTMGAMGIAAVDTENDRVRFVDHAGLRPDYYRSQSLNNYEVVQIRAMARAIAKTQHLFEFPYTHARELLQAYFRGLTYLNGDSAKVWPIGGDLPGDDV